MIGEWCYFKSYLDSETCERIIREAQSIPAQDGIVGISNGVGLNTDVRKSKVRFISDQDTKFSYIFYALWQTALKANQDFFNFHLTKLDFIQVAEYDASYQGEYKVHQDVFWINNDPVFHRKLSCVIQLSDPNSYEGGDLELVGVGEEPPAADIRQQGSITYFPSFVNHKANPVTRGTRYSIAAWFEGPKWR